MTKKLIVVIAVALCACTSIFARPHGGHHSGYRGGYRFAPIRHHCPAHYYHRGSMWGHRGRNFWPGFVGGVVGGVVGSAIASPAPVVVTSPTVVTSPVVTTPVVTTPIYTTQQVWVPGGYVDQVQPNGTVVRVWRPGRYVTRQVLVQ